MESKLFSGERDFDAVDGMLPCLGQPGVGDGNLLDGNGRNMEAA